LKEKVQETVDVCMVGVSTPINTKIETWWTSGILRNNLRRDIEKDKNKPIPCKENRKRGKGRIKYTTSIAATKKRKKVGCLGSFLVGGCKKLGVLAKPGPNPLGGEKIRSKKKKEGGEYFGEKKKDLRMNDCFGGRLEVNGFTDGNELGEVCEVGLPSFSQQVGGEKKPHVV